MGINLPGKQLVECGAIDLDLELKVPVMHVLHVIESGVKVIKVVEIP